MAVALTVLLWLLAGLVGAVLLLLVLPVRITARAGSAPPAFALRLRLLGGLLPEFAVSGGSAEVPARPAQPAVQGPARRKRRRRSDRWAPAIGKMARAAPALLAGLLRPFRIEFLRIDARFGLGDPAATGELFGLLAPLAYGTAGCGRLQILLRPEFDSRCLAGNIEGAVRFVPAALIPPALRFAWAVFVR